MANPAPSVFIFMDPLNKPSAGKSEKVKREVRSHVTTRTHRKRKEQETLEVEALVRERWEAQMRDDLVNASFVDGPEEKEKGQQQERIWDGQGEYRANVRQSDAVIEERNGDFHHPQSLEHTSRPNVTHSDDLWNPMISAVRGGPVAFHLHLLNDPSNEIGSIFHDLKIDALDVVTCYQNIANTQALEWEQQFQPLTTPGKAQHFLPAAVFQDPALVSAWCLIGTAQLLLHQDSRLEPRIVQGILRLRGHAIRDINLALDDPSRATSDVLIVAVLLLATADALHGFRESYPLHMAGLMEMINAKGGFSALGFEGCLEAFVLWQDAMIARKVGGRPYGHLAKNKSPVPSPAV